MESSLTILDRLHAGSTSGNRRAFLRRLAATFAVGLGWERLEAAAHAATDDCPIYCTPTCGSGNCVHSNSFHCVGCGRSFTACYNRLCTGFCMSC